MKFPHPMSYRDNSQDDIRYDPLADEKSLLERPKVSNSTRGSRQGIITYSLTLILLVVSLTVNVISWLQLSEIHQISHNNPRLEEFDSPVLRAVGNDLHLKHINGSFEKMNIYRGKASQEVDDAWLALGPNDGSIVIPYEDADAYGIKKGQVKRLEEEGGGYMGDIFVFHHLHCLNLMRQTSHWSWDYYRAKAYTDEAPGTAFEAYEGEDQLELHFTHCLDVLRQEVMCASNTAIYGQWYVEDSGPVMDFNFNRQCKNFDAIRQWYAENHVDMANTYVARRPGDPVLNEAP